MSLLDKFNELEYLLLARRDTLVLHSGTPFVLLVYDPGEERLCQARRQELAEKLESRGLRVYEIRLGTFIFDYYRQEGRLERLFALERERPQELRRMLSGIYRPALVKHIVAEAGEMEDNAVIFLSGVGSLYPFASLCNLLGDLENRVKLPLVVFYPGSEQDGRLMFLNLEEEGDCRARRI
jgi:hypothetical protein